MITDRRCSMTWRSLRRWLTPALLVLTIAPALGQARPAVFACEPEWAALTRALLPEADLTVATTAWQDPHYIEARPSLIAALRDADLAVCSGASLEAGWLPSLLRKAANPDIRPGGPGLLLAAETVPLHQPHQHVDRSLGDVHPEGNPHIHLDPDAVPVIAGHLAQRLQQRFPGEAKAIQQRLLQWRVNWNLAREGWRQQAAALAGQSVVVQHGSFHYLLRWLGVDAALDLEPKPGLPPSTAHLHQLANDPALENALAILVARHQDRRPADWLADRQQLAVLVVPGTVTDEAGTDTLAALIGHIVEGLVEAMETTAGER